MKTYMLSCLVLSLVGSGSAMADPIEDGKKLSEEVIASWKGCLADNVDRYSRSNEDASLIVDVAFTKCADWDIAVKKVSSHRIAVFMMGQVPFERALKLAENDADNTLSEMKARLRPTLVARVMDNRLDRRNSR